VTYYLLFDGNGNITEYIDGAGSVVAQYQYDPFGNTTLTSGTKADDFAYRFSTKPLDSATGLYYYGYRWYDPLTGRWPSRDPIEEEGGLNLYGFVGNDGIRFFDFLGLVSSEDTAECCQKDDTGKVIKIQKYNPEKKCCWRGEVKVKRDCQFTVFGGHGSQDGKNNPTYKAAISYLIPTNYGDKAGAVCCFSIDVTGAIPEDSVISGGIDNGGLLWPEGVPKNPELNAGHVSMFISRIEAAEREAEKCDGCCKKITVVARCLPGGKPDFKEVASKTESGRKACNYINIYDCETKQWKSPTYKR
jgi:RHS repeat-associated protein